MAEIILYITTKDVEVLREWLNQEPEVAWIVKAGQMGLEHRWRATQTIDRIHPGEHELWHRQMAHLNVPSAAPNIRDSAAHDPQADWTELLNREDASGPRVGESPPGPYLFRFSPNGQEAASAIGRSGFNWQGDAFRLLGSPAPQQAKRWWQRLGRFVRSRSTGIPWPSPAFGGRSLGYAFPDAFSEIMRGWPYDANPNHNW